MKAIILAGGLGTRLSEETEYKPKPMVEIGDKPIIWHIMKIYSFYGIKEFIICCGYKGYQIKEYFVNYELHASDINLKNGKIKFINNCSEEWDVSLIDTGLDTLTGGRLKRLKKYIGDSTFCFTYGDGLSNVNISKLIKHHKEKGLLASVTAVQPPGRYGALNINSNGIVDAFQEKPDGDGAWINGGFFVLEPSVLDYIEGDYISWENEPLDRLSKEGQISAYLHHGFWRPMDTLRDKLYLNKLWNSNEAPWKVW